VWADLSLPLGEMPKAERVKRHTGKVETKNHPNPGEANTGIVANACAV